MAESVSSDLVYKPRTLGEALSLVHMHPAALIFSGGIEIMLKRERVPHFTENRRIIYIGDIKELSRISRTERYLEIGTAASLAKILNIGKNVIPDLFYQSLLVTGTPAVKNLATLGGNICAASAYSTVLPALFAMDARIEIRSVSRTSWVPVNHFVLSSGMNILKPGEMITRIRIPFREWFFQAYRKIASRKTQRISNLVFCGLAKTLKNVLTDVRLAYGSIGPKILRNREYEASFIGRKLPINGKDLEILTSELGNTLERLTTDNPSSVYKKKTSVRLTRWFFEELNELII